MSKRTAETQMTKDGNGGQTSLDFSVAEQIGGPQRATAAQLANRRIAQPRGSARRGQARPPGLPSQGVQQPMPPLAPSSTNNAEASQQQSGNFSFGHSTQQQGSPFTFGMPATNTNAAAPTFGQPANHAQQQAGSFMFGQSTKDTKEPAKTFSFGSSNASQASASFPTAGASSSTGFTASAFSPATASFDFIPAQPQPDFQKNPLKRTAPAGDIYDAGFQGQIFKLGAAPASRPRKSDAEWGAEGREAPQWAPMHEGPLIPTEPILPADQRPPGTPANPKISQDLSNQDRAPSTLAPGIQLNASSQPEAGEASSSSSRPPRTPANPIISQDLSNQNNAPSTLDPRLLDPRLQLNASSQPDAGEASSSSSRPLSGYEQLKANNREFLRKERIARDAKKALANSATTTTETQPQVSSTITGQPEPQRQQSSQGPAPSAPTPTSNTPMPAPTTPKPTPNTLMQTPNTPRPTPNMPKPAPVLTFAQELQDVTKLEGGLSVRKARDRELEQRRQKLPSQTQAHSTPKPAVAQPLATGNNFGQPNQQQQPTHGQAPSTPKPAEAQSQAAGNLFGQPHQQQQSMHGQAPSTPKPAGAQSQATSSVFGRSNPQQPSPTQVHNTRKPANAPSQPTSSVFAQLQQTGTMPPSEGQIPAEENIFGHLQGQGKGPVRLHLNGPKPVVRVADMPLHPIFQSPEWTEIYNKSDLFPQYSAQAQPVPSGGSNSTSEQQHRPVEKQQEQETNNLATKQTQPPMPKHDAMEQQQKQAPGSALGKLQKSKEPPSNVFGQQPKLAQLTTNSVEQQQTRQQATSSVFGEQQELKKSTSNAFGQQQESQLPTKDFFGQQRELTKVTGNVFGGHQEAQQPTNNVFGGHQEAQQPTNNVFGGHQEAQQPTNNVFGGHQEAQQPTSNVFGGHQEAQQPTSNVSRQWEASQQEDTRQAASNPFGQYREPQRSTGKKSTQQPSEPQEQDQPASNDFGQPATSNSNPQQEEAMRSLTENFLQQNFGDRVGMDDPAFNPFDEDINMSGQLQQQPVSGVFDQQQQPANSKISSQPQEQSDADMLDQQRTNDSMPGEPQEHLDTNMIDQQHTENMSSQMQQQPNGNMFNQHAKQPNGNTFGHLQSQPASSFFSLPAQQNASNVFSQFQPQEASTTFVNQVQQSNTSMSFDQSPPTEPQPSRRESDSRWVTPDNFMEHVDAGEPLAGISWGNEENGHGNAEGPAAAEDEPTKNDATQNDATLKDTTQKDTTQNNLVKTFPAQNKTPEESNTGRQIGKQPITLSEPASLFTPMNGQSMSQPSPSPPLPVLPSVTKSISSHSDVAAASPNQGEDMTPSPSPMTFPAALSQPSQPSAHTSIQEFGKQPAIPADFTDEDKRHFRTAWRLRCIEVGLGKRMRYKRNAVDMKIAIKYYEFKKRIILATDGGNMPSIAGSKRKTGIEQPYSQLDQSEEPPQKRSKSMHVPNGTDPAQVAPVEESQLEQVEGTHDKRPVGDKLPTSEVDKGKLPEKRAGEELERLDPVNGKKARFEEPLQTSRRKTSEEHPRKETEIVQKRRIDDQSETSNIFKDIVGKQNDANKIQSAVPDSGAVASLQRAPSASKPPVFELPTFNAGSSASWTTQFGKTAAKSAEQLAKEEKAKRKAEEFDSDEDDEAQWERNYEERLRAKRQKVEAVKAQGTTKLVDGKFVFVSGDDAVHTKATQGTPPGYDRILGQALARRNEEALLKEKTVPPPKVKSIFGSLPDGRNVIGLRPGVQNVRARSGSRDPISRKPSDKGSSAENSRTSDADDERDNGREGDDGGETDDSQKTSQATDSKAPKKTTGSQSSQSAISQHPQVTTDSSNQSSLGGLFDRVSKDKDGNLIRETPNTPNVLPPTDSAAVKKSPFGSLTIDWKPKGKADTHVDSSKDPEGGKADHTWKPDSTIKFGVSGIPPTVNVISPSPPKQPFSSFFGAPTMNNTIETPAQPASILSSHSSKQPFSGFFGAPTINNTIETPAQPASILSSHSSKQPFSGFFGAPTMNNTIETPAQPASVLSSHTSQKAPSVSFNFGFTPANPTVMSLAPPSNEVSAATSRATTPGITTGESANESTADAQEDEPKDTQINLTASEPGEQDEEVVFEVKGKALVYNQPKSKWDVKGLGILRVLRNRETSKTRMLMRSDPSGNILLNTALVPQFKYESNQIKHVRLPFANENGNIGGWTLRVGKDEDAKALAGVLEANKSN